LPVKIAFEIDILTRTVLTAVFPGQLGSLVELLILFSYLFIYYLPEITMKQSRVSKHEAGQ